MAIQSEFQSSSKMPTQVPDLIHPLLEEYMALVNQELPGFMIAFYLQGSIALGAFIERFSDIDFICVVSRPCTTSDSECLSKIHQTIAEKYPRWALEGSYLE